MATAKAENGKPKRAAEGLGPFLPTGCFPCRRRRAGRQGGKRGAELGRRSSHWRRKQHRKTMREAPTPCAPLHGSNICSWASIRLFRADESRVSEPPSPSGRSKSTGPLPALLIFGPSAFLASGGGTFPSSRRPSVLQKAAWPLDGEGRMRSKRPSKEGGGWLPGNQAGSSCQRRGAFQLPQCAPNWSKEQRKDSEASAWLGSFSLETLPKPQRQLQPRAWSLGTERRPPGGNVP